MIRKILKTIWQVEPCKENILCDCLKCVRKETREIIDLFGEGIL
jgi:hypothetical protein